jgi:hypothetical protein
MALATQLTASGRGVSGAAYLTEGMSAAGDPMFASDQSYITGVNVVNRGGNVTTRPPFRRLLTLPSGNLQNLTFFRPILSSPYLIFVVDGKAYQAPYPFLTYEQIPNIQMYAHAPEVYTEAATQSAVTNPDGTVSAVDPKKVLLFQDGALTRAAYWDVAGSGHIDPSNGGVPLGGPMKWSGDRLWVFRKNMLFAGDISNPLGFTENLYAAEGGFFQFDDPGTALGEAASSSGSPMLIAFTARSSSVLQSGIRDRSSWKVTPNFQSILFPEVGCISQRSVVSHYGLTWWMTETGLTNLNVAGQSSLSSKIVPQDLAFRQSKAKLNPDMRLSCAGAHENFLLFGVPYASKFNSQMWVRDQAILPSDNSNSSSSEAWAGLWNGIRPVQFAGGSYDGAHRLFCATTDEDGVNRIWEIFPHDRLENESGIVSVMETKTHIDFDPKATGLDRKRFLFAELHFTEVKEPTTVELMWKGTKGEYKTCGTWLFKPSENQIFSTINITEATDWPALRGQARLVRSPNDNQSLVATPESKFGDWVDVGFSLAIRWTGRASLRTYRIFVDPMQETGEGEKAADDTAETTAEAGYLPLEQGYSSIAGSAPSGVGLYSFDGVEFDTFAGVPIHTF